VPQVWRSGARTIVEVKKLAPYLGALMYMAFFVASDANKLWRAAELYGNNADYLIWKMLVGGTFPAVLTGLGAIWFLVIAERSLRAAITVPVAVIATAGLVMLVASAPISSTLIGPLAPGGEGTVGGAVHTYKWNREPQALVITVTRNDSSAEQVNAFTTNGAFPSGTVELVVDRLGNTWVAEPPVANSVKSQGTFLLLLASAVATIAMVARRYFRRSGPTAD